MLHSAFTKGGAQQGRNTTTRAPHRAETHSILASVRRVGVGAAAAFRAVATVLQASEAREACIAAAVEAAVNLTAAVLDLLMKRVRLAAALAPLSTRALSEVVSAATGWCREMLGLLLAIEPSALGSFAISLGHDVVACSRRAGLWASMHAESQTPGARTPPCAHSSTTRRCPHHVPPPTPRHSPFGSRNHVVIHPAILLACGGHILGVSPGASGSGQQEWQCRHHDAASPAGGLRSAGDGPRPSEP